MIGVTAITLLAAACTSGSGSSSGGGEDPLPEQDELTVEVIAKFAPAGQPGGPFINDAGQYRLRNNTSEEVSWKVLTSESWVQSSTGSGVLAPSQTTTIQLSLDQGIAQGLAAGSYPALVTFRDDTNGKDLDVPVTLSITAFLVDPPEPFMATRSVSGSFTPNGGKTYSITNLSSDPMDWDVTVQSPWLSVQPPSGRLSGGETVNIVVGVDQGAVANIGAGVFTNQVRFSDVSGGLTYDTHALFFANEAGWTELSPSSDSRLVFVSSSEGDDLNDGLTVTSPLRTLSAGIGKLRDGYPDWLLLKRGDVWTNETLGSWRDSGRSASEPMVISSYGDEATDARPLIRTGSSTGLSSYWQGFDHFALVGIHFEPHTYTGTGGADGMKFNSGGENILIEDCYFQDYSTNIVFQGSVDDWFNVAIRRNILVDAYATDSHSQGIFANDIHGLVLHENFMHHNGWREGVSGANQTVFNHNAYLNVYCTDLDVQGNISTSASSHGMQVRPGGIVLDNLIVRCAIGIVFGSVGGGSAGALPQGVTGEISRNVVLECGDIGDSVKGKGIEIANISSNGGAMVSENVVAHNRSAGIYGFAFKVDGPDQGFSVSDLTLANNLVYDMNSPFIIIGTPGVDLVNVDIRGNRIQTMGDITKYDTIMRIDEVNPAFISFSNNTYHTQISNPNEWFRIGSTYHDFAGWTAASGDVGSTVGDKNFTDPTRDLGDYVDFVEGGSGATLDDFVDQVLQQSARNWRPEYTAKAVNDFIRAGFDL